MKSKALLLVILVALAGCSASYKGDIKSINHSDPAKNGRYIVSQTGTTPSDMVVK
jgi:hypothetical protein